MKIYSGAIFYYCGCWRCHCLYDACWGRYAAVVMTVFKTVSSNVPVFLNSDVPVSKFVSDVPVSKFVTKRK